MKNIVFLYAGFSNTYAFDRVFSSQSAFDRCLVWALGLDDCEIFIASNRKNESNIRKSIDEYCQGKATVVVKDEWNGAGLLESMAACCAKVGAKTVIYSMADLPFLDHKLTAELMDTHDKYMAEYTFQDGYPRGFAPEVIDAGVLNILCSLATGTKKTEGCCPVSNDSIFNIMKGDINSFDIETVMAPKDWRLLRLDFSTSTMANLIACQRLYDRALETQTAFEAQALTELAERNASIQRTVPAFYNVQINAGCSSYPVYSPYSRAYEQKYGRKPTVSEKSFMSLEKFKALVHQMADFSHEAVVSVSLWGECLLNSDLCSYAESVLMHTGLKLLIETDGLLITPEVSAGILEVCTKCGRNPEDVMWIVSIDAFTSEMYNRIRSVDNACMEQNQTPFERAVSAVSVLMQHFPKSVYPQFVRMNENEGELEQFYRFWHKEDSPSSGRLVIQKYDRYCGLLEDKKPADLSPLNRNVCWHLKRDMCILWDGSVLLCKEDILDSQKDNVFNEGIKAVWEKYENIVQEQTEGKINEKCRKCDEYYTFNF